jgi:hypothetical protein
VPVPDREEESSLQFVPSAKRVAVLAPVDVGQNFTLIVFDAAVPREKLPLPCVMVNCVACVPVRETLPVAVPTPVFVRVKEYSEEH